MSPLSRREFLQIMAAAGVAANATDFFDAAPGFAAEEDGRRPLFFDLHVHAMMDAWNRTTPFGQSYGALTASLVSSLNSTGVNLKAAHQAGVDVLCVPHYNVFDEMFSMPADPNPAAQWHTRQMINLVEDVMVNKGARYGRVAKNASELRNILSVDKTSPEFRVAIVHALEGAHAVGGDLSFLAEMSERGIMYITITHFRGDAVSSASNALPFFADIGADSPSAGLFGFGRELIREMESLGMIVDVTHMTTRALDDTLSMIRRPVMATHAASRTLADRPYSLYDEHIQEIAAQNGLVGVILVPYFLSNYSGPAEAANQGTLYDAVQNIEQIIKVSGSHEHVAVGSDFGAFVNPPKEMSQIQDIGILRDLLVTEFGAEIADDILFNNARDFVLKNWGPDV